jgi:phytoene dehydrogenase-like protein
VYDVIVLGGQLAGAVAAALLARQGHRVLLVEHDGLGPGYEHGGYLLPYAPFVTPSMKSMPVMDEVLTELGLNTAASRALRAHVPELQLVLPEYRFDLPANETRRAAELARAVGDPQRAKAIGAAISALAAFHEQSDPFFRDPALELPPDGMMETWGLKSLIKRHPQLSADVPGHGDEPALRLLHRMAPFLTYQAEPQHPLARARALSQTLAGPERYPGGREGLRDLLNKKLQDLGGDLLSREGGENFIAEQIAFDGDKVVGVKLLQSDMIYRAQALVAATDSDAIRRLITEKKKHRKLSESLEWSSTKQFLFTVNWVIKETGLPRGMGELVLHATSDDLDPILIQQHAARRAGGGKEEEGLKVLTAGVFVPGSTRDLGEPYLAELSERIGAHLDALMPFSRQHVVLVSAPYLHAGGLRGSRLLPHPLFQIEADALLGVEGLNQRTPVKNLFLANREVLPGLGLEGELLAGRRAARLVQGLTKKRPGL